MHVYRATRALSALALAIGLALIAVPVMAAGPSPAWTKQFGSAGTDEANGVAVGGADRVYVVGSTFGSVTGWPSRGGYDAFVRVLKPNGKKAWTKQFGSTSHDYANGVAVDGSGNVYVVGTTSGSLGGASKGSDDVFVRKYKPDGKKAWTKQFGTSGWDGASAVAVDPTGNVYVVGVVSNGIGDAFVRKYKPDGSKVWHRRFGTAQPDDASAVAVDRSGNVYVAGKTNGSLAGTSKGNADAFVRKYKPNGSKVWTRQFGTSASDWARGVAVDQSGRVYVAGGTYGSLGGPSQGAVDAFVRKYKPNGNTPWTRQFGTTATDSAYGVAIDQFGRVYVAGRTDGSLAGTLSGGSDAFVRKYRSDGDHAWSSQFGTSEWDVANGIAVDSGRRAIVAGGTNGSVTGWPSRGEADAYVRAYKR